MSDPNTVDWGPTIANVVTVIVAALIAVWGSIRGAERGAKQGAEATREATTLTLRAQQAAVLENERRQSKAVRLLLRLEFAHNLQTLETLWADITRRRLPDDLNRINNPAQQRAEIGRFRARVLIYSQEPKWSRVAWEGLTPQLPMALSVAEIEAANRVYGHLEAISTLREQLSELQSEQPFQEIFVDQFGQEHHQMHYPQNFYLSAPRLWGRIEEIVNQLHETGNPIAEDDERVADATLQERFPWVFDQAAN